MRTPQKLRREKRASLYLLFEIARFRYNRSPMRRLKTSLHRFPPTKFMRQAFLHRGTIYAMALRDFESRYIGTLGGTIWAVIQPLATIAVFYFVFAVGFRVQSPGDAPFTLWFVCGLAPWFLFNDTLQAISSSVTDNAHLVKKTVFPTEVLALVKVVSALLPHLIFLLILVAMLFFFDVPFRIERTLVVYYFICIAADLLSRHRPSAIYFPERMVLDDTDRLARAKYPGIHSLDPDLQSVVLHRLRLSGFPHLS
jgi:hypothetical protein